MALNYPKASGDRNGYLRIQGIDAKTYTNDNAWNPTTEVIELPLPLEGLKFTDGMSYENHNFGLMRNAIVDGKNADVSQMSAAAVDTFKNLGNAEVRRNAVSSITAMLGVGIGQVKSRTTPNPNTRSVFKSPNLREFTFSWKLNPVSTDEAEEIDKIIKELRREMYPKRLFPQQETRIGYKYPSIWNIMAFVGGPDSKGFTVVRPLLKPCWLVNMDTNMGSGGAILARSGENLAFAETTINLRFQEELALTSEDIDEGY